MFIRSTSMNRFPWPTRCVLTVLIATAAAFLVGPAAAQEESVRPGINKSFEDPNVQEFVERFEKENREIFAQRKAIVAACKPRPGMAVADVGAGTGLLTRLFAAEVGPQGRVFAVDIAPKFIEHIEKTCREAGLKNVTGVVCTSTSCQLPPQCVDLVFICDTYHHFEFPQKTLASIHQALRPQGQLIVVDYHRIEGKTPEAMIKHLRAGQEVFTREIESAGFQLVDEPKFLKDNYFLRFQKTSAGAGQTR
jgi:ubiquinone/menaquinone biosynthesis C-methylase UbiE